MSNQGKRISKDYKKEKTRVYPFAGYLRVLPSWAIFWREQKYLAIFATFANTKNAIIRLFVLFCGLME